MPLELLPCAIAELYASATATGKITLADRYGLLAAMLTQSVSVEEMKAIDRLLYSLRRGHIHVVDELSALLFHEDR